VRCARVKWFNSKTSPANPASLEQAYDLTPSLGNGANQIVAIVDAHDNPNVATDTQVYQSDFGVPGTLRLTK
jgi:subtilase family serine protease